MRNTNNINISEDLILDYCLDTLDVTQREALEELMGQNEELISKVCTIFEAMNDSQRSGAPEPAKWKEDIWSLLQNISLEKRMDLKQLPLINRFSDHHRWSEAMKVLMPKHPEPISMRVLTQTDKIMQALVVSSVDIPEEEHDDMMESFMLLEGECECRVGDKTFLLEAGGYLSIPLHEPHDVKLLSERVVAILQRVSLS